MPGRNIEIINARSGFLSNKLQEFFSDPRFELEGSMLPRSEWIKKIKEELGSSPGLLIMVDFCGQSCGQLNRNWLELMTLLNTAFEELGTKGLSTIGRKREQGEDEVMVFVPFKGVLTSEIAPLNLFQQLYTSFNNSRFLAYFSGVYLPPAEANKLDLYLSQALHLVDLGLKEAKESFKKRKREGKSWGEFKDKFKDKSWWLNGKKVPDQRLLTTKTQFPDFVTLGGIEEIKEILKKGGRIWLFSPYEMKRLNQELGMSEVDRLLIKMVRKLQSLFGESARIFKIGTLFVVIEDEMVGSTRLDERLVDINNLFSFGLEVDGPLSASVFDLESAEES